MLYIESISIVSNFGAGIRKEDYMQKFPYRKILVVLLFQTLIIIVSTYAQRPDFPEGMPIVDRTFTDDPDKFTYAIIGDKTGGGLNKWHIFDRSIDEINILKPDFAIMVGDLIQGDTSDITQLDEEWKEFWEHQSRLDVPFLPLPGNHDITNRVMYDYWKKHIGRTYSAFTYKNCLFLLLNTEEWHANSGEWTNWFGEEQIKYVQSQLKLYSDVRHTFVMLHRPLWLQNNSGWEEIEEALGDRQYTVFAGHYHNLSLHTRNDRRYFVLGATGGGFTPQQVKEYGAFDHYSLVTVDSDEVKIAIIEPGNIHPEDISTTVFKDKVSKLLNFNPNFQLTNNQSISSGNLEITFENTLEKPIQFELRFNPNDKWQITPNQLSIDTKPGQTSKTKVTLTVSSVEYIPFPIYKYSVLYGGEQLLSGTRLFHPIEREHMRVLKNWKLLGPFDLGVDKAPANTNEVPKQFLEIPIEVVNLDRSYQGKSGEITWQEHTSEIERIKLDKLFGNAEMAYGYGVTYIKSPFKKRVFAQMGWGSNLGKIYLNGKEIPEAAIPGKNLFSWWAHFEMTLKKGWNTLTVLSADYNGWWDFRMEIADPADELSFRSQPIDTE